MTDARPIQEAYDYCAHTKIRSRVLSKLLFLGWAVEPTLFLSMGRLRNCPISDDKIAL